MATVRTVVQTALRKTRIIASGETPSADEANDGLQALQSLYTSWVSGGLFGRLTNKIADTEYTAGENERIKVGPNGSVLLPETVEDEWSDGRLPRNRAVVVVVNPQDDTTETHLYDAGSGGWIALDALDLESEAPLSNRDVDGLASCLAEALAEDYGTDVGPYTLRRSAAFRTALANSFDDPAGSSELQFY